MSIDTSRQFGLRECPSCATEVPQNENRCPICGYEFPARTKPHASFLLAIGVTLIVLLLGFALRLLR